MTDYNIYCYDNNNSTKIYKYVNKKEYVKKPERNLLAIIQLTDIKMSENKNINILKNNLIYLFEECFRYKQFCKITLVCFNEECFYYEISKDNFYNILHSNLKITGNNISYNKLNNIILNNIIDTTAIDIVFLTNGINPLEEKIDESISFLKSICSTKDITLKLYLLSYIQNYDVLDKYMSLVDKEKLSIINIKDNNFSYIIEDIVPNIKYINIFGTNFKLNIVDKIYEITLYDFLYDEKYDNCLQFNVEETYNLEEQLEILNMSIYVSFYINDICKLEEIIYKIHKLETNIYDIHKFKIGKTILDNIYYIYEKIYNFYIKDCKNIFLQDIIDISNISVLLKNIFMNKYKYKFIQSIKKNIKLLNNEEDCEDIKINENCYLNKSKDIFYSVLTISDWIEELENKNIMGILIRTNSISNISKLGYKSNKIINVTSTIITFKSYKEIYINYYKNNGYVDSGIFNVKPLFSGNTIGEGNIIFPLYICEENWNICKKYFKPLISLIVGQNPLLYKDSYINIIFKIFFSMIVKTFNKNNEYTNNKWIYTIFAVYMTCKKAIIEYNINLDGIYYNFIKSVLYRTKHYTTSLYTLLGYIIVKKLNIKDMNIFIKYILEEKIRRDISKYLLKKIQIYNYIKNENGKIEMDNIKLDMFIKKFKYEKIIENLMAFNKFYKLMEKYRDIEKQLYNTYSIIPETEVSNIQKYIKNNLNNEITFEKLMENVNGYNDTNFIKKCIVQGIEQKNEKIRTKYIKKGYYQNLFKTSYEDVVNNIIKRYNNDKDIITINYVNNNLL